LFEEKTKIEAIIPSKSFAYSHLTCHLHDTGEIGLPPYQMFTIIMAKRSDNSNIIGKS